MKQRQALIKISGDLLKRKDVLKWLKRLTVKYLLTIVPGGGTQINRAFIKHGYKIDMNPVFGRQIHSEKQSKLALKILKQNALELKEFLVEIKIPAKIELPMRKTIRGRICHINGDFYALTSLNGYDKVFVVTLSSRVDKKFGLFKRLFGGIENLLKSKLCIVGFPD